MFLRLLERLFSQTRGREIVCLERFPSGNTQTNYCLLKRFPSGNAHTHYCLRSKQLRKQLQQTITANALPCPPTAADKGGYNGEDKTWDTSLAFPLYGTGQNAIPADGGGDKGGTME
jgi:hypothetical protein